MLNTEDRIPAAYMPADDLLVGLVSVSSKSVATIHHPQRGLCSVPCSELRDAHGQWYTVPADDDRNGNVVIF